jgi:hypothetical protein
MCHNTCLFGQGFYWQAQFFVNISAIFGSDAAPSQFDIVFVLLISEKAKPDSDPKYNVANITVPF